MIMNCSLQAGVERFSEIYKTIREGDTTAFKADVFKFINCENGNAIFEVASFKSAYKLNISQKFQE